MMSAQPALGPASTSDRLVAMTVDWVVCLGASYLLAPVSYLATVRLLGLSGVVCTGVLGTIPLVYLTWGWARGSSLGMNLTHLRMERVSGGPPGITRAAARAVIVYPFGTATAALGLVLYARLWGHYPSGAESATSALRFIVLVGAAGTYLLVVLAGRRQGQGRALHDLMTGVVVFGPKQPEPKPRPRPAVSAPPRQISRWFLLLVPPALIVGVGFLGIAVADWSKGETGPSLVGFAFGGSILAGLGELLRHTSRWRPGPYGVPMPTSSDKPPRRVSRWFLVFVPPLLLVALILAIATLALAVESEAFAALIGAVLVGMVTYGIFEILRRTFSWSGREEPAAK